MATLYDELLLAIRSLRRSPTFTIVSVLSLAVGIGANVAVFSLVNALLIRPLPVREPERLVRIGRTTRDNSFGSVSFPEYRELRDGANAFSELVGHYPNSAILTAGDEPRTAWLELVTSNYFSALGVRFRLGRGFVAESDRATDESAEMVISHSLWQQRFGGNPSVLGRVVKLNGHPFTLVGVAPSDFYGTFTGFNIDTWVPVAMQAVAIPQAGSLEQREDRFLMLIGRLGGEPGATRDRARSELAVLAQRLHLAQRDTTEQVRLEIASAGGVHPFVAQIVATFLALLQGIVFLVLLLACVNLANVLLVRASVRRRELAMRAALGASRWRLARLLLAETFVIAAVGGVLGVVLAVLTGRALERINLPVGMPLGITMDLDARVAFAALAVTMVVAVAFGAGPALAASRADALADLRVGGATADRRRGRIRSILVGAQVMLATVLLVGSSLLLRSMQRSQSLDPGFDASSIELISASPELLGYDESRGRALWNEIVERASRVPGVRDATLALFVPLGSRGDVLGMAPKDVGERREPERLPYNYVRPGYFRMLGIPLVAGRDFLPADDSRAADVIVISETMSRRFFGKENAVGRVVGIVDREGRERRVEVVGVVRDIKLRSMGEPPSAIAYLPFGQWYRPDMILHFRTEGGAGIITRQVMAQIRSIEPELAMEIEPMTRATEFSLIPLRVAGSVLGFSGFVGLFLASLGVFGLVAYAVSLRTREIGIRMALGAGRAAVVKLVAFEGMRPVLIGLGLGLVAAFGAGQLLRRLLVGIGPSDPVTLVTVCAVLLVSAVAAVIVPVRRAVMTDPADVLRMD